MANAAAKKAAAARSSTSSTYLPIVLIINVVHFLLRLRNSLNRFQLVMTLVLWILTAFAYRGIVEDAATQGGSKSDKIAGGASLDLLGIVVLVQFGSVLYSDKFYWILAVPLPLWGLWRLYSTVRSVSPGNDDGQSRGWFQGRKRTNDVEMTKEEKDLAEKRRKRAERRRQKWS